jgi:cell division septal protein FtsQ
MIAFVARNQARWLALAGALALSGLIAWMLTDSQFSVRNARTAFIGTDIGSVPVDHRPVQELFMVPENLFLLSGTDAAARLGNLPEIAWAEVRPRIDGSVVVSVQPALAVANWSTAEGFFLVDRLGNSLAAGFNPDLELAISSPGAGTEAGIDPAVLETGHRIQQTLAALGFKLDHVQHSPASGMIARTDGGALIYLGTPQSVDEKLSALIEVVDHARGNNLRLLHVDLRPLNRPTFRAVPNDFDPQLGLG